jgi:hypothetical protein
MHHPIVWTSFAGSPIVRTINPKQLALLESSMGKNRLEAFSDGVIAILITIMVLELKVPHSPDLGRCCHSGRYS